MTKLPALFTIFLATLALTACAESYQVPVPAAAVPQARVAPAPSLPGPASANLARLYFYRAMNGSDHPTWTPVWLNGARVGDSGPGTFFFRDVQPGTYTVTLQSDLPYPDQFKTVTVSPGSTTYLKIYPVEGWGVGEIGGVSISGHHASVTAAVPNVFADFVVDPRIAPSEIAKLQPIG
jgi:hypothetical protein